MWSSPSHRKGSSPRSSTTHPRLAHAAEKLRVEHAVISAAIDRGSVAVRSAGEDPGGVEDAREAVLKLLQQLIRHRQRGADLVYEAYNVDIEAGD